MGLTAAFYIGVGVVMNGPIEDLERVQGEVSHGLVDVVAKYLTERGLTPFPVSVTGRLAMREEILMYSPRKKHFKNGEHMEGDRIRFEPLCDFWVSQANIVTSPSEVTCKVCLRRMAKKAK